MIATPPLKWRTKAARSSLSSTDNAMGRHRKTDHFLPARVYRKGNCYWYSGTTPWTNLGPDITAMYDEYAKLEKLDGAAQHFGRSTTFGELSAQYRVRELVKLARRTQRDYAEYLDGEKKLLYAFSATRLVDIEAHHVTTYHARRGEKAAVQANREKACFSSIWNWGRRVGIHNLANPCQGVKRHTELGRGVLVDDVMFFQVWSKADWDMRDVLELAWLTGQRPADVFEMRWDRHIKDGALEIRQGKTRAPVRVAITGELAVLLCDIALRRGARGRIVPMTYSAFDNRFDDLRKHAGVAYDVFQLRDMRSKAGTEVTNASGIRAAQELLGHTTQKTTETYVRRRQGALVKPVR
jgi:integrase